MKRFRRSWVLAGGVLVVGLPSLWAQKPKSPKEVAAIQAVQAAKTPDEQVKAIENVLTNFADTEFKNVLLQMAMQIETQKGDFTQTVFYAERLLDADPKSVFALNALASETARHTREFDLDKEEKLAKVDKWAKAALEGRRQLFDGGVDELRAALEDLQATAAGGADDGDRRAQTQSHGAHLRFALRAKAYHDA